MPMNRRMINRISHQPGPLAYPNPQPGWLRRLRWLLPLALTLAALTGFGIHHIATTPRNVADLRLAGARGPAPVNLVLVVDDSGSFTNYITIRDQAIQQVLAWAPKNLRPGDTITITAFATGADIKLPTTTVADIAAGHYRLDTSSSANSSASHGSPSAFTCSGSCLDPGLRAAQQSLNHRTGPVSLIVVTDTQLGDLANAATTAANLSVATASLLRPRSAQIAPDWTSNFGYALDIPIGSLKSDATSIAIATAIAHATGQHTQHI